MMTNRLHQALRLCLLAVCSLVAQPLLAQTTSIPTPPQVSAIDDRGVDLVNALYRASDSFVSIGVAGHGGLTHSRVWVQRQINDGDAAFTHNYIISLTNYGNTPVVTMGGQSLSFSNATAKKDSSGNTIGYSYDTGQKDGLVLTAHCATPQTCGSIDTWQLIEKDGSAINFTSQYWAAGFSYYTEAHAIATNITHPNGEVESLNYKTATYQVYNCFDGGTTCGSYASYHVVRLQSVTNNLGYMLHFSHGSDALAYGSVAAANEWLRLAKVQTVNLAQSYCDPVGDSCASDSGSVSYSQSYSGRIGDVRGYAYQYVTLPDGRAKYYRMDGGGMLWAIQSIGSSTEDIQVSHAGNGGCDINGCRFAYIGIGVSIAGYGSIGYNFQFYSDGRLNTVDVTSSQDTSQYHRSIQIGYAPTTQKLCGFSSDALNGAISYQYSGQWYYDHRYQYDQYCRITSAGSPLVYTSFVYDDRGNATSATVSSNYGGTPIVTSASYPAACTNSVTCNKPTSVTDNAGKVSSFTYDPVHGGVLSATAPAASSGGVQPQTRTSYAQFTAYYKDATGTIVAAPSAIYLPTGTSTCITTASCTGTADEVKTSVSYGATGIANNLLPVSTTTASGDGSVSSTTSVTYDAVGNKVSEDGPLPGSADTTVWTYNADRQVTQVVGPDPDGTGPLHNRAVKTSYNVRGQPTSVDTGTSNSDGSGYVSLGRIDTIYDNYFRKTSVIAYGSNGAPQARTDFSYDVLGRVDCSALRMNPALFAPANSTPACTLGTQGNFGADRITKYLYSVDRVVQQISGFGTPLQRTEFSKSYGGTGQLSSYVDARANVTQYTYDYWDRLQKTSYPSPTTAGQVSTTDFEQLSYDANGRLATRQLRDGKQISYSYDNLGCQTLAHMVNPVDANDRDIATSYDLLGRVTQVDDGAGKKVSFSYDALGRKLSESPQLTGGSTSYQYDAAGRRTRLTWSDGFYVTYDYDTLGELLAIRENGATSGVGVLASFAYDDQGKPTGLTRGNGVNSSYTYDAASRLQTYTINHPSAGNSYTFAYNPAGQLVSRSMSNDAYAWTQAAFVNRNYTVNGLNQYTASGSVVPTYDGRGNMTSAGSTAYVYDSKNKLTTFGANALGYDAMGRLATQAAPATRFVYDGSDLIAETDASNNILRRYIHIPGTDNVLVWYEGSGTSSRRWLAHDERGSTTLITDASGASLGINAYDEYGIPQSTNLGRFQYTGQAWLPELGMYYYKARIYSPTMGRFMQTDPTGYADGPNWYNYTHGDPINGSDPSGTDGIPTQAQIDQMRADSIMMQIRSTEAMMQGGDLMRSLATGLTESQIADQTVWEAGPQMAEIAQYHAAERAAEYIDSILKSQGSSSNLRTPGVGDGPPLPLKPLSPQDSKIMAAIMATSTYQSRASYAWDQTKSTGNEHGFFIFYAGGTNFILSRVYEGTKLDMGASFGLASKYYGTFYADYHSHPGSWASSAGPSYNDLSFSLEHNAISVIQSYFGTVVGRGW